MNAGIDARRLAGSLLTLLLAVGMIGAAAQPAEEREANEEERRSTFSITFDGGPVTDFLALVRDRVGRERLNIIAKDGAEAFDMPAMNLAGVRIAALQQIIPRVASHPNPEAAIEATIIHPNVLLIETHIPEPAEETSRESLYFQAIPVSDILDGSISAEDLLSNIEESLDITEAPENRPRIRFHPQMKTLSVLGANDEIRHLRDIIEAARESATHQRSQLRESLADQLEAIQSRTRQAKSALDRIQGAESRAAVIWEEARRARAELEHVLHSIEELRRHLGIPEQDDD